MLKVIQSQQLMHLEYADFKEIRKLYMAVYQVWQENISSFKDNVGKTRRMDNRSDFGKFKNLEQDPLKERLENITIFRQQHHKLKDVISKTLIKESIGNSYFEEQALNEVNEAYALFVAINVLDITEEGKETWQSTKRTYDLKIDKIES